MVPRGWEPTEGLSSCLHDAVSEGSISRRTNGGTKTQGQLLAQYENSLTGAVARHEARPENLVDLLDGSHRNRLGCYLAPVRTYSRSHLLQHHLASGIPQQRSHDKHPPAFEVIDPHAVQLPQGKDVQR